MLSQRPEGVGVLDLTCAYPDRVEDEELDRLEEGPEREPPWDRLSRRARHGLALVTVFVLGLALGGATLVGIGFVRPPEPVAGRPPELTGELLTLTRNDTTGALYVDLRVTNQGDRTVQVNRLLAQAVGYVIIHTSPQPPAVGGALQIPAGKAGTVGLVVRETCGPTRNLPTLTVLAALGDEAGESTTVLVRLPQEVRQQLRERRLSYCRR